MQERLMPLMLLQRDTGTQAAVDQQQLLHPCCCKDAASWSMLP